MRRPEPPTEPIEGMAFPVPTTSLSLRHAVSFLGTNDDGEPILIISDGVSAVAFEAGIAGPSVEAVAATQKLAANTADFAAAMSDLLSGRRMGGAHRRR